MVNGSAACAAEPMNNAANAAALRICALWGRPLACMNMLLAVGVGVGLGCRLGLWLRFLRCLSRVVVTRPSHFTGVVIFDCGVMVTRFSHLAGMVILGCRVMMSSTCRLRAAVPALLVVHAGLATAMLVAATGGDQVLVLLGIELG